MVLCPYAAVVRLHRPLRDRQTQADPACLAGLCRIHAHKGLENSIQQFHGHPRSVVSNLDDVAARTAILRIFNQGDVYAAVFRRMADGIAQHVVQRAMQEHRVAEYGRLRGRFCVHPDMTPVGFQTGVICYVDQQLIQFNRFANRARTPDSRREKDRIAPIRSLSLSVSLSILVNSPSAPPR